MAPMSDADLREYRLLLRTVRYIAVAASGRRTIPDGQGMVWRRGVRRRHVPHASVPLEPWTCPHCGRGHPAPVSHCVGCRAPSLLWFCSPSFRAARPASPPPPAVQDGNSVSRGWICASCGREQMAHIGRCIGCGTPASDPVPLWVRAITARSFPEEYLPPD